MLQRVSHSVFYAYGVVTEGTVEIEDDSGQSSILQWLNDSIDEHILYAVAWFGSYKILGSARGKIKGDGLADHKRKQAGTSPCGMAREWDQADA